MKWTTPNDLEDQLKKVWESGAILSSLITSASIFPMQLKLKQPSSREMTDHFESVRTWISALHKAEHFRIETREFKHRVFGKNKIPESVWIDTLEAAVNVLGTARELDQFAQIINLTKARQPCLLDWLARKPFVAVNLYHQWSHILDVVGWMLEHPRPDIYVRQVSIKGLHTKFIETHRSVLTDLLDIVLPINAIDQSATGVAQFNRRYGFRDKPLQVRFRMLDPNHALLPAKGNQDITLDRDTFLRLNPTITRVFITENETNFLAFPSVPDSMIIFGGGYGFEMIKSASWLLHREVYYWGDIDTHGFAILNSLRKHLPHTRSLFMDERTLLLHQDLWVTEDFQHTSEMLTSLTTEEQSLYQQLVRQRFGTNVRLEQEQVNWTHVFDGMDHTQQGVKDRVSVYLTASDLHTFLSPSECGLRTYLREKHETEEPLSLYQEVLQRLGRTHETRHLSEYSNITDLSGLIGLERIQATYKAINERKPVIYQPLLAGQLELAEVQIEIRGEPDLLVLEDDRYVVRDVKMARRINDRDHPEIILQLQLYSWLMTEVTGMPPARLEVCNGENCLIEIADDGGRAALGYLTDILKFKVMEVRPYVPVGWTKCAGCPFYEKCWSVATEGNDVACLAGVDQELAKTLQGLGCTTMESLLSSFDETRLANIERRVGTKLQRVGKKAGSIILMARAMTENRTIRLEPATLPLSANYVMFDLEGLPPHFDEVEKVYLWGMQIYGARPSSFTPAVAGFGGDGDKQGWTDFLHNASRIFEEYGDIPFIHWHHYERVKLDMYVDRYGDIDGVASRVRSNLIDLLPIAIRSVALPLPSYSLKVVEKYLGFQRTQEEFGGNWAMAKYIEAMESFDDAVRQEVVEQILLYNREDLEATWHVFQWLQNLFNEVPAEGLLATT